MYIMLVRGKGMKQMGQSSLEGGALNSSSSWIAAARFLQIDLWLRQ
jgi:hypothetical protein